MPYLNLCWWSRLAATVSAADVPECDNHSRFPRNARPARRPRPDGAQSLARCRIRREARAGAAAAREDPQVSIHRREAARAGRCRPHLRDAVRGADHVGGGARHPHRVSARRHGAGGATGVAAAAGAGHRRPRLVGGGRPDGACRAERGTVRWRVRRARSGDASGRRVRHRSGDRARPARARRSLARLRGPRVLSRPRARGRGRSGRKAWRAERRAGERPPALQRGGPQARRGEWRFDAHTVEVSRDTRRDGGSSRHVRL